MNICIQLYQMESLPEELIITIAGKVILRAHNLSCVSKKFCRVICKYIPIVKAWRMRGRAYNLSFNDYIVAFGSDEFLNEINIRREDILIASKYGNINMMIRLLNKYTYTIDVMFHMLRRKIKNNEEIIQLILIDAIKIRGVTPSYINREIEYYMSHGQFDSDLYCRDQHTEIRELLKYYPGSDIYTDSTYSYRLLSYKRCGVLKKVDKLCKDHDISYLPKDIYGVDIPRVVLPCAIEHGRIDIVKHIMRFYKINNSLFSFTIRLATKLGYNNIADCIRAEF